MRANRGSGIGFAGEDGDVDEFHVVVATSRPTLAGFFAAMGQDASSPVLVTAVPLSYVALADAEEVIGAASAAVVDASHDPLEALEFCRRMRVHRPALPIGAVFCCPNSATPTLLRALAAAGVAGFFDLQLSPQETLRVLRSVARGQGVLHLHTTAEARALVFKGFAGEDVGSEISDDDTRLLELVALGLTDDEIGRQMFLSRHTVKHRIERLRRRVEARNRVQLAVWASRQHALRG
jgi:DNA-binding NarL/FixJ family response regulator